jgi:CRP/FNR family cyclic AMP-dependent transcriptional regulator
VKYVEKVLGSVELFKGLSAPEVKEVAAAGHEVEFRPGAAIVKQGLRGMDFFLILKGQARLEVPKKEARTLGPGDHFGEISVLDGKPRTATVIAGTRVLVFRLARKEFVPLLDRHGSIARKILVEMCGRLRYAESRM